MLRWRPPLVFHGIWNPIQMGFRRKCVITAAERGDGWIFFLHVGQNCSKRRSTSREIFFNPCFFRPAIPWWCDARKRNERRGRKREGSRRRRLREDTHRPQKYIISNSLPHTVKQLSLAWPSLLPIQKLNLFVFWKMMRVHLQLCLLILLLVISFVSQAHCDTRNLLDRPARGSSFRKLIRRGMLIFYSLFLPGLVSSLNLSH